MIKRISAALSAIFLLCTAAIGAGTISLGGTQQFNATGTPLIGCKLYFYVSGTTTPQNSFKDSGLTILHQWPLECDSSGRIPFFYLADGTIKIRLTDSGGSTIIAEDGLVVVGPSSGGGGGGTVDATAIYQTGDFKLRYGTGVHTGWVRAAGRTIGSVSSGATERANADCQTLFEYLWDTDPNLSVSGGRGASANADWSANKTIALPDYRGALLAGLADMGNTATTILTSTYCGANPTVLGILCGAQSTTLLQTHLPNVNFTVSGFPTSGGSQIKAPVSTVSATPVQSGSGVNAIDFSAFFTVNAFSGTAASGGSGTAFSNVPPVRLQTIYIKL